MELVVKNLSKSYSSRKIFENLSLTFPQGVNYIISPNGTGKSTLLKLISGIEKKDKGDILFNTRSDKFSKYGSYVPDKMTMYPFITGKEFIDLIFHAKHCLKKQSNLDAMLNDFNIIQHIDTPFKKMSLGTQKKFFIVAGLIGDFSCLLMDEPSNAIDKYSMAITVSYLKKLSNNKLILIATHDQNLQEQLPGKISNLVSNIYP
jgi:ABC-2 type transport system ATP-binding protein